MKQSRDIGKEPSFSRIVIVSAILHLLFVSLLVIPLKTRERDFRSYYVTLVGPIRTPSAGQTPSTKVGKGIKTPQKAVKAPPKADITLESVSRVKKEIERIRAISALKKRKKNREKTRGIQIGKEKADIYAQGARAAGRDSGKDTNFYYGIIEQKIERHWVVPGFDTSGLEVIISIKIDKDGKVISQKIAKSSGDMFYDRSAIKAILKASPFPPPPAGTDTDIDLIF